MKLKLEKKLRILNEVITYFHKLGSTDLYIDMGSKDNSSYFFVSGEVRSIDDSELENLTKILNTKRQHEVEYYYWNLGGESELDCELTLLGMMIDKVDIIYENNILTLKIFRNDD